MVVPLDKISGDALAGLIEEFILREGTDYGKHEYTLEQKHEQIKKQLVAEKIFVVFDPAEESASIVRKENIPRTIQD
ncbi:MAG: YheU family protein [Bdellovibrio sp.]|nr:YheU family protein [Bdellovibrio sp.]